MVGDHPELEGPWPHDVVYIACVLAMKVGVDRNLEW